MKIQTGTVEQHQDIAAGVTFLNVPYQMLNDDGSVAFESAQAFPMGTDTEEIKAFLRQALTNFIAKAEGAVESQAAQAVVDAAQVTATEATNITIEQ